MRDESPGRPAPDRRILILLASRAELGFVAPLPLGGMADHNRLMVLTAP